MRCAAVSGSRLPGQFLLKDRVLVNASVRTQGDFLGAALPRSRVHIGTGKTRPPAALTEQTDSRQAEPVRAGDRLRLKGRLDLRLAQYDHRGGLHVDSDAVGLDLADRHRVRCRRCRCTGCW